MDIHIPLWVLNYWAVAAVFQMLYLGNIILSGKRKFDTSNDFAVMRVVVDNVPLLKKTINMVFGPIGYFLISLLIFLLSPVWFPYSIYQITVKFFSKKQPPDKPQDKAEPPIKDFEFVDDMTEKPAEPSSQNTET